MKKNFCLLLLVFMCMLLVTISVFVLILINLDEDSDDTTIDSTSTTTSIVDRQSRIPSEAAKIQVETDVYPPILHSTEYYQPVPIGEGVNTAGAEDSPFILPDGKTLYFFFTPDPSVAPEKQLFDEVTGIYVSEKIDGEWSNGQRVVLQDKGKLALDGCEFVSGDTMWFCSTREGYEGINWFTAEFKANMWQDWSKYPFDTLFEVGELHITKDGNTLYYHSSRAGGKGQLDIWKLTHSDSGWQNPVNISAINSSENEGWPFVTEDGTELWFTRIYLGSPAIYRSRLLKGEWQVPELIISQFAGEPTLDRDGNLYFVHHYYKDNVMLEADIYVAERK